jgi:carboxylesterase type B
VLEKVWPGIQAGIISHCANEAYLFVPKDIDSQGDFDKYLATFLPGDDLSSQRNEVRQQYDCNVNFGGNFTKCVQEVIQDLSFTCNTRQLLNAYPEISYMMEYAFPSADLAYHASDLIPLFMNNKSEARALLELLGASKLEAFWYAESLSILVPRYQNYLASFALGGDPNALSFTPFSEWPIADGSDDKLSNVMKVGLPLYGQSAFKLGSDNQNTKSKCNFWVDIAKSIVDEDATGEFDTTDSQKILLKEGSSRVIDL